MSRLSAPVRALLLSLTRGGDLDAQMSEEMCRSCVTALMFIAFSNGRAKVIDRVSLRSSLPKQGSDLLPQSPRRLWFKRDPKTRARGLRETL